MTSLSDVEQAEVIEAFGSTSRYLDDLLGVDSPCFGGVVGCVCPPGLRLGRANTAGAEAPFLDFVNCRQFMYLVISLLVLRAGYGI